MTYVVEMFGGPGRLRTYDNPVMSRGLYQLSYGSNSGNMTPFSSFGKRKDRGSAQNVPPEQGAPPRASKACKGQHAPFSPSRKQPEQEHAPETMRRVFPDRERPPSGHAFPLASFLPRRFPSGIKKSARPWGGRAD